MINKAKQNYIDFAWSLFDILNKQQGEDKEDIDYGKAPDELTLPETIIALQTYSRFHELGYGRKRTWS